MNYSDTERMETYLEALGFKKNPAMKRSDLIVFNTCSIRQKAEDRIFGQMVRMGDLKRQNKNLIVAITGCMVRNSSSKYSAKRDKLFMRIKELDVVIKNDELPLLAKLIREVKPELKIKEIPEENLENYFQIAPTHSSHKSNSQAFIAISNGCDKFCTYCIVPYSRGREKSRPIDQILKEAKLAVENGAKEIILIGQTVNSYGLSTYDKAEKTFEHLKKEPFVYLLEEMDKFSEIGLERVRFTSPHPKDMSDNLIEAMSKLKTQMPHLHLPVQSGDNAVLKRMNRTYTVEKYKEIIRLLREKIPNISITTDVIVGFCGETEEEFENTCKFFAEMKFEHAFLAQYSERKGTYASKKIKDDIPQKIKHSRWHKLNEILKKTSNKSLKRFIGKTLEVLVESQEKDICTGRSEHYKEVQFKSKKPLLGQMVKVKITSQDDFSLSGQQL
jgi:tRNA-2-methylthio-N6-dimethylallyladenosine synthase